MRNAFYLSHKFASFDFLTIIWPTWTRHSIVTRAVNYLTNPLMIPTQNPLIQWWHHGNSFCTSWPISNIENWLKLHGIGWVSPFLITIAMSNDCSRCFAEIIGKKIDDKKKSERMKKAAFVECEMGKESISVLLYSNWNYQWWYWA